MYIKTESLVPLTCMGLLLSNIQESHHHHHPSSRHRHLQEKTDHFTDNNKDASNLNWNERDGEYHDDTTIDKTSICILFLTSLDKKVTTT